MGLRLNVEIDWGKLPILKDFATTAEVEVYKGEKTVFYALFDETQPDENKEVLFISIVQNYFCVAKIE